MRRAGIPENRGEKGHLNARGRFKYQVPTSSLGTAPLPRDEPGAILIWSVVSHIVLICCKHLQDHVTEKQGINQSHPSVPSPAVPFTLAWLATIQQSQTFTRCSKQNKLVTFLLGHLQSPMVVSRVTAQDPNELDRVRKHRKGGYSLAQDRGSSSICLTQCLPQ